MKTTEERRFLSQGRLLYTLLDAADDAGLLTGAAALRWQEAKTRIICGGVFEEEARTLHELLNDLAGTGVLANSWIDDRWRRLAAGGEAIERS